MTVNPAYGRAIETRDELHADIVRDAEAHTAKVAELTASLRDGRVTPAEARAQLRDIEAARLRLLDSHRGIEASEARLEEMEAMSPDDRRDSTLGRFPAMRTALNGQG